LHSVFISAILPLTSLYELLLATARVGTLLITDWFEDFTETGNSTRKPTHPSLEFWTRMRPPCSATMREQAPSESVERSTPVPELCNGWNVVEEESATRDQGGDVAHFEIASVYIPEVDLTGKTSDAEPKGVPCGGPNVECASGDVLKGKGKVKAPGSTQAKPGQAKPSGKAH